MAKDPIKKAENGTYYFRANLGYHPVTGKQIQKYRSGFSTKKEARAEYSKLILASTEELADKKEDITFKKFIEEIYLPWYKTQVKESTYKNRYSTIQKHFAYFYKKKVSEIEAINVQTWQLKLAKQFSPNYVRIVQGMLCLAFDRAIILGLAKKNPARMIGNIKSKKVKIDFWTLEEFQKVISLLYKGDYYEHYLFISFWLLFMTGMRIGEAAALQWDDIDFENKIIDVEHSIYDKPKDIKGRWYIGTTKTFKGKRKIYMSETLCNALINFKKRQDYIKKISGLNYNYYHIEDVVNEYGKKIEQRIVKSSLSDINSQKIELVFVKEDGTYVGTDLINYPFKIIHNELGITKCRFYDLRGSYATTILKNGTELRDVADILGHNNVETTENYYISSTNDSRKEATVIFDNVMNSDVINKIIKYEV